MCLDSIGLSVSQHTQIYVLRLKSKLSDRFVEQKSFEVTSRSDIYHNMEHDVLLTFLVLNLYVRT